MEKFSSAAALIDATAGPPGTGGSSACGRRAPRDGSSTISPVRLPTPTRRTAPCSCSARCTAPASAFRRGLAARDRGCGDDPGRAPALHASGEVAARHPPRLSEFGVRCFALDSEDELEKIVEETTGPKARATSSCGCASPCRPRTAAIPLERKFGVSGAKAAAPARQDAAGRRRARHHIPRRLADDDAGRLRDGAGGGAQADRQGGRGGRCLDIGGGFPFALHRQQPAPLSDFMDVINDGIETMPVTESIAA